MKITVVLTLAAVFLAVVSACTSTSSTPLTPSSGPTPESTHLPASPMPTAPLQPAPTLPPATVRPILTATSHPTPPPLPSKVPTATPEPTPTQPAPTPTPTPTYTSPTVVIGSAAFPVEVAVTAEQRQQGLSGKPSLASGAGMLFVFESAMPLQFWMKRMQFPLDFVWIGADCTIGEITRDVPPPPPGTKDSDLERINPQGDTQYVLEINAGEASVQGLEPGQVVVFAGSIVGRYGC